MEVIVIKPSREVGQYWRGLWLYRELLQVLAWRDIAVGYKQTAIGVIRAVMRPLLTMVVFTVVFGRIAKLQSERGEFRYIIPFIVQFGLYVSPVGFSSNIVPETWRLAYSLNPVVSVIDGYRWCLLSGAPIYWPGMGLSLLVTAAFLRIGLHQFRRMEDAFADII